MSMMEMETRTLRLMMTTGGPVNLVPHETTPSQDTVLSVGVRDMSGCQKGTLCCSHFCSPSAAFSNHFGDRNDKTGHKPAVFQMFGNGAQPKKTHDLQHNTTVLTESLYYFA